MSLATTSEFLALWKVELYGQAFVLVTREKKMIISYSNKKMNIKMAQCLGLVV